MRLQSTFKVRYLGCAVLLLCCSLEPPPAPVPTQVPPKDVSEVKPPNCPPFARVVEESCPCFFERISTSEGWRTYVGSYCMKTPEQFCKDSISRCCKKGY